MSSHSPLRRTSVRSRVEHQERLLLEGLGVGVDLLAGELGPGGRAAAGVPHARGVVADDQDHRVAAVLKLPQLAQHDGVAEVDVGRGRVDAELHPQRAGPPPAGVPERPSGQGVDGVAGEETGLLARGCRHGPNARLPPRRRAGPDAVRADCAGSGIRAEAFGVAPRRIPRGITMQKPPTTVTPSHVPAPGASGPNGGPPTPKPKVKKLRLALILVGPAGARRRLDGLRDDDGRRQRPARAREQGRVQARRRTPMVFARRARTSPRAGDADRQPEPDPVKRGRDLAEHQERGDRDRGPPLLRARGRRLQGHRRARCSRTCASRRRPRAARPSPSSS